MNEELERMVRELHDRQTIRDQLTNYCRAVDRMDRELLLSVYHPDAIDDRGPFTGGPEAFADWAFAYERAMLRTHLHYITNHTCDLDGDTAHTETYWLVVCVNIDSTPTTIGGGRYIDRFERRDGRWKIAVRKSLADWSGNLGEATTQTAALAGLASVGTIARDRSDCSYERPLTIDKARIVP